MATRLHFFTLVVVLLITLIFIGVVPQTNAARVSKYMIKDFEKENRNVSNAVPDGSIKRTRPEPRSLEEKDIKNPRPGSRPQRPLHRGIKNSVRSSPKTEGGPEDMRANPNPRVMGHGTYRVWRSQPSGMGEEENMEGREVIIPKSQRRHP
ncbi:unnamed protein product [Lactuca virosa]|uniref:Transmembrane protein n=1 Tax=Lactuca virosa TaxID=75947 RepID=A0AAU9NY32_9ASTR|nr:unnamed protein product [Lactuca virosa]